MTDIDYTLFLDMDGVLCNFDHDFFKLTGKEPREYEAEVGEKKFWTFILDQGTRFWEDLTPTKDMEELKEFAFSNFLRIGILSSSSKKSHGSNMVKNGKLKWLRKHGFLSKIPNENIIIVDSARDKKKYAWKNKILVDDYEKNVKEWLGAGGVGIHHKSAKSTIKQLFRYV
jgi:hypothetical protein